MKVVMNGKRRCPLLLVLPALFIIYGDKEAGFIPELLGQSYSSVG